MIRAVLEGVFLFLIPFALFGLLLALRRRHVFDKEHWSPAFVWLVGAGFALAIASLLWTGLFAERHTGVFEPAHMENGRLVPGRVR